MQKRFISLIILTFCAVLLCSACGSKEIELPIAELNENITHPEGKLYTVNKKPAAEGGLSALGTDYLKIMVEGKEYTFKTSDEVRRKINIFNEDKDNLRIKIGTFLMLEYEIKDGEYYATDIGIVESN